MKDDFKLPEVERYVLALLSAAAQGPKTYSGQSALVENAALRIGLDWVGAIPRAASDQSNNEALLKLWIGYLPAPRSAFEIAAHLVDGIDRVVRARHPSIRIQFQSEPSKFDQHVFIAVGQTICRAVDFHAGTGPSAVEAWKILAKQNPRVLQRRLLRNYIGNVLQEYFDASEIRAAHYKIPKSEEEALRTEDAEDLAYAVFDLILSEDNPLSADQILAQFRRVITKIWTVNTDLQNDSH